MNGCSKVFPLAPPNTVTTVRPTSSRTAAATGRGEDAEAPEPSAGVLRTVGAQGIFDKRAPPGLVTSPEPSATARSSSVSDIFAEPFVSGEWKAAPLSVSNSRDEWEYAAIPDSEFEQLLALAADGDFACLLEAALLSLGVSAANEQSPQATQDASPSELNWDEWILFDDEVGDELVNQVDSF
ncbi:hypothetical protein HDU84_001416 [Entophlyctis sp. JEL0112]|nr:hypothetical protein HDU84_001416 [Entophlyctis sp. JEL0112]